MGILVFGLWAILTAVYPDNIVFITIGAILLWLVLEYFSEIFHKAKEYDNYYPQITSLNADKEQLEKEKIKTRAQLAMEKSSFEDQKRKDAEMINILCKEKSKGYPSLAQAYSDYFKLLDLEVENSLRYKSHPARKSADKVRDEGKRRRKAEYDSRTYRLKLYYLFELFPHLEEYLDIEDPEEEIITDTTYSEEEKQDLTTSYMPRVEWLKLPTAERNDLALQRYWKRKKRSFEIGKMYERYIGYLFEKSGHNVEYTGIIHGFDDLGRDLVVSKEGSNKVFIIQCKCWAHYKTIHVAFINQLYGTAMQYQIKNKDKEIIPMFYTTISLDDTAREFANYLKIEAKENFAMDNNYPCVKCNISRRTEEKIYHLPFDQQYDKTKIEEERNEVYVATCKEAEDLGFRRAWRWRPEKGD